MASIVLMTPRELPTDLGSLHNERVTLTDADYAALDPALRQYYEKIRENLGLACLAAALREAGHTVTLLNLHGKNPSDDWIGEYVAGRSPDLVGIAMMYDLHTTDAVRLAEAVRRRRPEAIVVVGGAFCTYNSELILREVASIDAAAYGEAEITMLRLAAAIDAGADWSSIAGLYVRAGDRIVTSGPPELPRLDDLPWPARDALHEYAAAGLETPVASTYASRGCHAKCTFCYAPRQPGVVGSPWRVRAAVDVVDEIEYLQATFGTRQLWFNDDNFGGAFSEGSHHAIAIAEEILRRGIDVRFHCEFRVDSGLIDVDALRTLRRAGMASTLLGLESGSPGALKRMRKGTTVHYNHDAAVLVKAEGIELDPGWIMIDPGSTLDELWESFLFAVSTRIHEVDNPFFLINRAIALRGTEMFDAVDGTLERDDVESLTDPAQRVLAQSRADYTIADPRVEDLWAAWSEVGGRLSERRENEVPFLAQELARRARAERRTGSRESRVALSALREWTNGLAELFLAFINTGLTMAEHDATDLQPRLVAELEAMARQHDEAHLDVPFEAFAARFEADGSPAVVDRVG